MKRMTYVDKNGNQVDQALENKKLLLRFFFVFGTVLPIILLILIIVTVFQNSHCSKIYDIIKKSAKNYVQDEASLPEVEGENVTVSIGDLYAEQYLKSTQTNNTLCSGTVKITKYKKEYIYTIDVKNCNSCSTDKRFKTWSNPQTNYPKGKTIVDVIPYYNYYDRDINITKWSRYYDDSELADEESEYGVKMPLDQKDIPEVPKEANIFTIEKEETKFYRYRDKSWKWYDIVGNYSEHASEKPAGYANKDENTLIYTDWTEYVQNYPEEKEYRTIEQTTGYKLYYLNDKNEKVYYNDGKYSPRDEVNTEKYDKQEPETITLYHYRDKMWRWYNGTKRNYSNYSSQGTPRTPYKDEKIEMLGNPTSWDIKQTLNESNKEYRLEESKIMTRFRIKYEFLTLLKLKEALPQEEFEEKVKSTINEFNSREDVKLEVTYKFKYKK